MSLSSLEISRMIDELVYEKKITLPASIEFRKKLVELMDKHIMEMVNAN